MITNSITQLTAIGRKAWVKEQHFLSEEKVQIQQI